MAFRVVAQPPSARVRRLPESESSFLHVEASPDDNSTSSTGCASLSGTVFTPGKTDPLYNAIVYVAKGKPDAIMSGASCDKCGGLSPQKRSPQRSPVPTASSSSPAFRWGTTFRSSSSSESGDASSRST